MRVRAVTPLLTASWKRLFVLLCSQCKKRRKEKNCARGFAPFLCSRDCKLECNDFFSHQFSKLLLSSCACVCWNAIALIGAKLSLSRSIPSLGMIFTFGCAGARRSWRTSQCHDSYPLLYLPPSPSLFFVFFFSWWLGNGAFIQRATLPISLAIKRQTGMFVDIGMVHM